MDMGIVLDVEYSYVMTAVRVDSSILVFAQIGLTSVRIDPPLTALLLLAAHIHGLMP